MFKVGILHLLPNCLELPHTNPSIIDNRKPHQPTIRDIGRTAYSCMAERPDVFSEKEFERLFALAKIAKFTAEEMEDYMHTFKQCDYYNVIRTAEEEARERGMAEGLAEGMAEGIAEGIAEGRMQERMENIRKLLNAGVSMETIAAALELTEEEIKKF